MKRKTVIFNIGKALFPVLFGLLLTTNAHAFLVTTDVSDINIRLVPADPNENFSITWFSYSGNISGTASKKIGNHSYSVTRGETFDAEPHTSLTTETDHSRTGVEMVGYNTSVSFDLSEEGDGDFGGYAHTTLNGRFRVQGEGAVMITTAHSSEFDNVPDFDLSHHSNARISLTNRDYYYYEWQNDVDKSYLSNYSSDLTNALGVSLFFHDGEIGDFNLYLSSRANNGSDPYIPIPNAIWLFGSGLSVLTIIRKGGGKS